MSDTPIDFQAAHDKRHGPDAEFVVRDEKGVKWFKFTCHYTDAYSDGQDEFSFEIWATDAEDAQRRMALVRQTGKVDGQLFHEVLA